jgi:hypothetical protein
MEDGRKIESAGRCLAAALAQTDRNVMASLLRAAAKYLEVPVLAGEVAGRAVDAARPLNPL